DGGDAGAVRGRRDVLLDLLEHQAVAAGRVPRARCEDGPIARRVAQRERRVEREAELDRREQQHHEQREDQRELDERLPGGRAPGPVPVRPPSPPPASPVLIGSSSPPCPPTSWSRPPLDPWRRIVT